MFPHLGDAPQIPHGDRNYIYGEGRVRDTVIQTSRLLPGSYTPGIIPTDRRARNRPARERGRNKKSI